MERNVSADRADLPFAEKERYTRICSQPLFRLAVGPGPFHNQIRLARRAKVVAVVMVRVVASWSCPKGFAINATVHRMGGPARAYKATFC